MRRKELGSGEVRIGSRLLDFLDSDRAKRHWGRWKFVRCLVAWTIWFCRYRRPPGGSEGEVVT